jgi:hypothetical protein
MFDIAMGLTAEDGHIRLFARLQGAHKMTQT